MTLCQHGYMHKNRAEAKECSKHPFNPNTEKGE